MPEEDLIQEQQAEKRSYRRLLWSFVWLALAVLVGVPLLWSWSVTRKWERLKAEYAAAGETLDATKLVTEEVPDEENVFGMDELYFAPATTSSSDQLDLLCELSYDLSCSLENGQLLYRGTLETSYKNLTADFPKDGLPAPQPDMPATVIRTIDANAPWVVKLLGRLDLPKATFRPTIRAADPLQLGDADELLYVRGVACWEAGDMDALAKNLRLQMCFLNAKLKTGFLRSNRKDSLDLLWVALEENRMSEAECRTLLNQLGRFEVPKDCLHSIRERGAQLHQYVDAWFAHRKPAWLHGVAALLPIKQWYWARSLEPIHSVIPALKSGNINGIHALSRPPPTSHASDLLWKAESNILPHLTYPASAASQVRVSLEVAKMLQTKIDLARVALAAELYHFRRGTYPDHIGALVPDFLPAVPLDLIDGKPLRYRLDRSRYRIWSIGGNEVDDGGKSITATMWRGPDHQGDSVWYYPKPPD